MCRGLDLRMRMIASFSRWLAPLVHREVPARKGGGGIYNAKII